MNDDKISTFRGPMVTATGIILGFLLNYMTTWVRGSISVSDKQAYFIGCCVFTGTVCLIFVLFRTLNMCSEKQDILVYYKRTLYLFIFGISVAFLGFFADMLLTFMAD